MILCHSYSAASGCPEWSMPEDQAKVCPICPRSARNWLPGSPQGLKMHRHISTRGVCHVNSAALRRCRYKYNYGEALNSGK